MKTVSLIALVVCFVTTSAMSQNLPLRNPENNAPKATLQVDRPNTIGSSLWVLSNLFSDPAHFYKLSYGYQFTTKDNFIVDASTWTYEEPLGAYGSADEYYPGEVKAYGIGLGYQRFHWKKLFTTLHATNFLQQFYDDEGDKIQRGYQLYLQFIAGYRIELFKQRLYLEPAYSFRYWPVNTNFPASFEVIEHGENNYKIEASLNFGIRF